MSKGESIYLSSLCNVPVYRALTLLDKTFFGGTWMLRTGWTQRMKIIVGVKCGCSSAHEGIPSTTYHLETDSLISSSASLSTSLRNTKICMMIWPGIILRNREYSHRYFQDQRTISSIKLEDEERN